MLTLATVCTLKSLTGLFKKKTLMPPMRGGLLMRGLNTTRRVPWSWEGERGGEYEFLTWLWFVKYV